MIDSIRIVLENSAPLFITIGLVLFLRQKNILPTNTSEILGPLIFKLVLPAFVFGVAYNLEFSFEDIYLIIAFGAANLFIICGILFFGTIRGIEKPLLGSIMLSFLAYSVGPVAYPFTQLNFDEGVFAKVVILDIVLFVTIMILAPIISAVLDPKTETNYRKIIKTVFTDVILISVTIGLVLNSLNIDLPESATNTVSYIGDSFLLLITVFLAMTLEKPDSKVIKQLTIATFGRLVGAIAVGTLLVLLFNPESDMEKAIFLTLFTPFSAYPIMYAQKHNLDMQFMTQSIIFSRVVVYLLYPLLIAFLIQ